MKKIIAGLISVILLLSSLGYDASAISKEEFLPYVVDFVIETQSDVKINSDTETRATGLIHAYSLSLAKTGTTLSIGGQTLGTLEVVKCGFKDLTIQRRKTIDDDWKDYYEYGNVYVEATAANLSTTLVVESGYQYRISCKHYAKKNLLSVQTVANTSNIVTVS